MSGFTGSSLLNFLKLPVEIISPVILTNCMEVIPLEGRKYDTRIERFVQIMKDKYYPKLVEYGRKKNDPEFVEDFNSVYILEFKSKINGWKVIPHPKNPRN